MRSARVSPSTSCENEEQRFARLLKAVNGGDRRMIQRCKNFGFASKSHNALSVAREVLGKDLNGDVTLEL